MQRNSFPLYTPTKLALLGAGGLVLLLTIMGIAQHRALTAELAQETMVLHRLASQRADQHDAHLTALSAIATASDDPEQKLFQEVAETITRFFPRITAIALVPLQPDRIAVGAALTPGLAAQIAETAKASDGTITLLPDPDRAGHYIMIKRSPNSDAARYGLILSIDAARLLDDAGAFWTQPGTGLSLSLPDGTPLFQHGKTGDLTQSKTLGSASQPLILTTSRTVTLFDIFPPLRSALILLAAALAALGILAFVRQRRQARHALEQARLSALDSRLAHAARVNAMGEMASGLAHELTQPLTAILAQAQAGRRLLTRDDRERLSSTLDDTVTQARRASVILERFRNWSRPQATPAQPFDLRDALRNVAALLDPQARAQNVALTFELPPAPVMVRANPVEMEQVAFNLLRNALEALVDTPEGQVRTRLQSSGDQVVLTIRDNGPGVAPDLRPQLFTPFTTSRADGTGLGLALSQRLVERAGGEIVLEDSTLGASFRITLPLAQSGSAP
ncbi:sensor histidine kinase [Paracoccus sulfuroxidans]|uniref:histidine kinase n=1 Tax=Paracoccus sulfuroxidans TaxID=384678 RepID=A0A562NGV7_9RHOB|nr:ATP-binding protein [Paracoccus sulfuroxidans]TWI31439.1 phospho-acceptor domain-containing protein [Paracoccus sulfuroxidans]